MSVKTKHIDKNSPVGRMVVPLSVDSVPISQANVLFDSFVPGFDFEIVEVQHFAEGVTATADYDVDIGTTSALAAHEVPVADTREDAALSATLANRQGSSTDAINLRCTTDGSGLLVGLKVKVVIRPRDMHGDPNRLLQ